MNIWNVPHQSNRSESKKETKTTSPFIYQHTLEASDTLLLEQQKNSATITQRRNPPTTEPAVEEDGYIKHLLLFLNFIKFHHSCFSYNLSWSYSKLPEDENGIWRLLFPNEEISGHFNDWTNTKRRHFSSKIAETEDVNSLANVYSYSLFWLVTLLTFYSHWLNVVSTFYFSYYWLISLDFAYINGCFSVTGGTPFQDCMPIYSTWKKNKDCSTNSAESKYLKNYLCTKHSLPIRWVSCLLNKRRKWKEVVMKHQFRQPSNSQALQLKVR